MDGSPSTTIGTNCTLYLDTSTHGTIRYGLGLHVARSAGQFASNALSGDAIVRALNSIVVAPTTTSRLILSANPTVDAIVISSTNTMNIGGSVGTSALNVKGTNAQVYIESTTGFAQMILKTNGVPYALFQQDGASLTFASTTNLTLFATDIGSDTVSAYDCGTAAKYWKNVRGFNAYIAVSDKRLKTDIKESNLGLNFINKLKPVSYKWKETVKEVIKDQSDPLKDTIIYEEGTREHYGLLAQDLKETLEEEGINASMWCLSDTNDKDSTQSVRYTELIGPMLKAIQELTDMNKSLLARIEKLER
jgi:hypothetical protein